MSNEQILRVLVADNNPVLLRLISAVLEQEGCKVTTATNGLEALEHIKAHPIDIVFTDLVMPQVGGEQLCRIIRSTPEWSNIYLVVISGIVLEDFDNLQTNSIYDHCIAKGELNDLRVHIKKALASYRQQRSVHTDNTFQGTIIPEGLVPSSITEELLAEKRHLHCILQNLDEGIVEFNKAGIVLSLNKSAEQILNCTPEKIIGTEFAEYDFWGNFKKQIHSWVNKDLAKIEGSSFDIREDEPLHLHGKIITASFLSIENRDTVLGLCILRDITRQYNAEANRRELDSAVRLIGKMDAMSSMAGGIAHDFNNLLTVICGNLDILSHIGGTKDISEQQKLVEHARSAAYIAVDLTRKISSSSPFGVVSRKKVAFVSLVEQAIATYFQSSSSRYTFTNNCQQPLVQVNPEQIGTVIVNIIENAVESDSSKPIDLTIKEEHFSEPAIIHGQYVSVGEYVSLTVTDYGKGIDSDNLLSVFDPYFSTKSRGAVKGMGLGLAVVYATIRNHGGYVVIESKKGEGTKVRCYLPNYGQQQQDNVFAPQQASEKEPILLIEADPQFQEIARIMMEFLGYSVTLKETLEEGVRWLLAHCKIDGNKPPSVVIDNYVLSKESLRTSCETIRAVNKKIRIVLTSNSAIDEEMKNCKKYGFDTALVKPFTIETLKHALQNG